MDGAALDSALLAALESMTVRDAAAAVATALRLPRRVVYARALEIGSASGRSS
jgi:16S rRNA (cytidine1402-2'-O)-methyltransferase